MSDNHPYDFPEFDERAKTMWNSLADWWDDQIGDGNSFQDVLIEPATEQLLGLRPGQRLLDVACGAGRFTRRMASFGAIILAVDQAERFLERARKRTVEHRDRIEYRLCDATNSAALLSLGEGAFDAVVCTMALMDMPSIEPLISSIPNLLKPRGRFVFSVTHPAFNSGNSRMFIERFEENGRIVMRSGVVVTDYAEPFHFEGVGIPGQPNVQLSFHRPWSLIFNLCFKHGLVLDGVMEPTLPPGTEPKSKLAVSWGALPSIPPVLVARMIPAPSLLDSSTRRGCFNATG
jgi:ubiquinone/menaquinone biosynthesis C-methylase UbiE